MNHHHDLVQQALQLLVSPVKTEVALTRQQALDPISSTIQHGDRIEWQRADLTKQTGVVDFIHVDDTGTQWAFATLADGGWAAVNARYTTHPPVSPDAVAKRVEGR